MIYGEFPLNLLFDHDVNRVQYIIGEIMNKRIVFRNMDHSDVMQEYADKQLKKIEDFIVHFNTPHTIDVYLEPSHVHMHHRVSLHVRCGSHTFESSCEHEGMSFYDALDKAIDVMYKKLHDAKDKQEDQKKRAVKTEEF